MQSNDGILIAIEKLMVYPLGKEMQVDIHNNNQPNKHSSSIPAMTLH